MTRAAPSPVFDSLAAELRRGTGALIEAGCVPAAVALVWTGVHWMAALDRPLGKELVTRSDFIAWAGRYMKVACDDPPTGLELYKARCAMLHCQAEEARMQDADAGYRVVRLSPGAPNTAAGAQVVVSVPELARAFLAGVEAFRLDLEADHERRSLVEGRARSFAESMPTNDMAVGEG